MIIQKLNVFLSPSTVKNILSRSKPQIKDPNRATNRESNQEKSTERQYPGIIAKYPNHSWSVDRTVVKRWLRWPIYVVMAIDHYSRKVVCLAPLEGPNSGWMIDTLEEAIETYGAPKHIITDQEFVFIGDAFLDLLDSYDISPRLGAVGEHGSIAVTERVIKTFKYEWLHRVLLIKGFDHIYDLCKSFEEWYNHWRPHTKINGAIPQEIYSNHTWEKPTKDSKTIPLNIETKYFPETRITGYRLKQAA